MIDLIQVREITDDLIQEFNLVREDQLYECYIDDIKIGYAIIRNNADDRVFLTVAKEYQNKGYGSIIFESLIFRIDGSIICTVPFENVKMQRIILKNNGVEIGRNGKTIQYIIEKVKWTRVLLERWNKVYLLQKINHLTFYEN